MSLHTLANHLQTAGRGDDSLLVHMTPREVHGLQSLAMAHGGSLTINPETGLPEAGFLSGILPMVAGAALAATGVGAPMAALMVGGAGAVATGSLSKGLMMGLGAYGGAGIGAGLLGGAAGAGASGLGAAGTIAAQNAANLGAQATSTLGNTMGAGMAGGVGAGAGAGAAAGNFAGISGTNVGAMYGATPGAQLAGTPNVSPWGGMAQANTPVVVSSSINPTTGLPTGASSVESATSGWMDKLKSMPGKAYDLLSGTGPEADKAREDFYKQNKGALMAGGLGFLGASRDDPRAPKQSNNGYQHINPAFTDYMQNRKVAAPGAYSGSGSGERPFYFADGGSVNQPVEQMSQENSVGANTNYPMANSKPYGYAVPKNYPISQNVFQPESYERVDPYTGEQKLADGGLATLHFKSGGSFVSKTPVVKAPTKAAPKLADTKKLEAAIEGAKKYGSFEEQTNKYNDLAQQIKDRQTDKANKAKELADRTKSYNADLAKMKAEQAARNKELNTEYTNRVNSFNKETAAELKSRQADIKNTKDKNEQKQKQTDLANYQKDRNNELTNINKDKTNALAQTGNDINNFTKDFNNFKNEVGTYYKDIDAQISKASKDQTAAQAAAKLAKQREGQEKQFEQIKTSNQSLIDKANADYETGMSKYNEYQNSLKDEQAKWEESTKRQATGLQGIKPLTSTRAAIPETPGTFTPNLVKDEKGNYVSPKDLPSVTEFKKFGSIKEVEASLFNKNPITVEPEDVTAIFQNAIGRKPTSQELDALVGNKMSTLAIAQYAEKQPDFLAKTSYNDDDLIENYKYYLGKDPSTGDLAALKKQNAAGKINNFKDLRTAIVNRPAYLDNINKVAQASFTDQQKVEATSRLEAEKQARSMTPEEVRTAYLDTLGRAANVDELKKYTGAHETLESLGSQLKGTDEYLNRLAVGNKPETSFTPATTQTTSFTPTPVTKYAPGTTLTYNPNEAADKTSATSTGAATGLSGLEAPVGRGTIEVQGAYPIAPDWFKQQIGIQNLATEAAKQATPLQGGLSFAAPKQQQNQFAFQPYVSPYAAPAQTVQPQSLEAILAAIKAQQAQQAQGTVPMASGGIAGYNLGGYSDGGRLLKGPGDGVSDSIPATIGDRQPARLADGEFVVPARIVSELGNGSTDAGAKKLYAMMQRIQQARGRTVGRNKVAVNSRAEKLLPA